MTTLYEEIKEANGLQIYAQEKLLVDVTEEILYEMAQQNVSKAMLAKKLKRSKSFVTRLLNGEHNMTLRTLSDVCFALGLKPKVYINEEAHEQELSGWQQAQEIAEEVQQKSFVLKQKIEIIEKQIQENDKRQLWDDSEIATITQEGWKSAA